MSDDNKENRNSDSAPSRTEGKGDGSASPASSSSGVGKADAWNQIHHDLKGALDSWSDLTKKSVARKTPEEQQLAEMRRLLSNLRSKIQEFEECSDSDDEKNSSRN